MTHYKRNFQKFKTLIVNHVPFLQRRYMTRSSKKDYNTIQYFEMHLVHHCNLRCAYCAHYSPLAEKWFVDADTLDRDLAVIAPHVIGHVGTINILGGEPLLHPDINNLINIVRHHLPNENLHLVTNGLLLNKMDDVFFNTLKTNNITLVVSRYPINLDYKSLKEDIKKRGVNIILGGKIYEFARLRLKKEGDESIPDNFKECGNAGTCVQLSNGKLFICPQTAYIDFVNKKFNTSFNITEKDFLEIGNIKSFDDIKDFISTPIPFCRYCDLKGMVDLPWKRTEFEEEETIAPHVHHHSRQTVPSCHNLPAGLSTI